MSNVAVIIMAGGEGTRFYPLSTPEHPKQFIDFFEDAPCLLKQTYERAQKIARDEQIYFCTNAKYGEKIHNIIPNANLILEQKKKNTGPALANAMHKVFLHLKEKGFTAVCLPSDHYIANEEYYIKKIKEGIEIAEQGKIVTLGITPTEPSTEYGYIKPANFSYKPSKIDAFVEKPNKDTAKTYVADGYLWNSGMFIWSYHTFMIELETHAPNLFKNIYSIKDYLEKMEPISIDCLLMEKTRKGVVIPTHLDWSDLGNWGALKAISKKIKLKPNIQAYVDRMVVKPWGYEDRWAITRDYVGKLLYIKKGCRLSLQYHQIKDETIMLIKGKMKLKFNTEDIVMVPGQTQKIAPTDIHRMEALEDCVVVEVSTIEIDDVVRVSDDYGREYK